jgi:hypothetical protein
MARVARSLAVVEDHVAETLMQRVRLAPDRAKDLEEQANLARQQAAHERSQARRYATDPEWLSRDD